MKKKVTPKTLLWVMGDRGISRTKIAFFAEIDLSRFSRICNGWLRANEAEQQRISEYLNLPKDELFKEFSG